MLLQCPSGTFDEGPFLPVVGPELSPKRYIPVSVENELNVLIGKPAFRGRNPREPESNQ